MKPLFAVNVTAYSDAWRGRGVSFTDMAKRCNMSKGQFSDMRSGNIHSPGVWTALKMAEAMHVTLDELVTDRPARRAAVAQRIFEEESKC